MCTCSIWTGPWRQLKKSSTLEPLMTEHVRPLRPTSFQVLAVTSCMSLASCSKLPRASRVRYHDPQHQHHRHAYTAFVLPLIACIVGCWAAHSRLQPREFRPSVSHDVCLPRRPLKRRTGVQGTAGPACASYSSLALRSKVPQVARNPTSRQRKRSSALSHSHATIAAAMRARSRASRDHSFRTSVRALICGT